MNNIDLTVLLLCPTGQDSALIAEVLKKQSITSDIVHSVNELCQLDLAKAGAIVLAEEALTHAGIDCLNSALASQEAWSDIPIILLTSGSGRNRQFKISRVEVFVTSGNVTLLERPLQPLTLLSSTQVALRSRRKQYEVRDLLSSQVEATNMRDVFISIASHELKTPLTSLKLQTQITMKMAQKAEAVPSERIQKQLNYTLNQVNRLNKLVDDMLDISRINTGRLVLDKEEFNLSELLKDLVERFTPQFEAVGCEIETHIEDNVLGVWDCYKIEQVVNNLFSNAIRYSPNKKIVIGLKKNSDHVILHVKDHGIGISPENLEKIFERFERAASTSSGLGLGLYITRQILELHNASIKVESEIGKGSNFIITLPLS